MKKLFVVLSLLLGVLTQVQASSFIPGQTVTAAELNSALANASISSGTISGTVITGGTIDNAPIGSVTPNTGTFSSLTNSGGYTQTGTAANYLSSISLSANSAPFLAADGTIYAPGTGVRIIDPYGSIYLKNVLLFSATAPTIASGFGTTPSIVNSNGTASFSVNVGTGGTATNGVITLPAATTNWNCAVVNPLSGAGTLTQQSAHTSTSVTLTNFTISTDAAVAWTAGYVIELNCVAK